MAKSMAQEAHHHFIYQNNDEKVTLQIASGNDFVIKKQSNPIQIEVENINVDTMVFSGLGITFARGSVKESTEGNKLFLVIDLTNQKAKGTHVLHFNYTKNGQHHHGQFEIPVKKKP